MNQLIRKTRKFFRPLRLIVKREYSRLLLFFRLARQAQHFSGRQGIAYLKQIKHYFSWYKSLSDQFDLLESRRPWIPYAAEPHLRRLLKPGTKLFEFGSGASTLYFMNYCSHVVSVEHDKDFFKVLQEHLERKPGQAVVDHRLARLKRFSVNNETETASENTDIHEYISSLSEFEDGYFDIIFIDGIYRNECITHSIKKVKAGGWIILDNAERTAYQRGKNLLDDWESFSEGGATPLNHTLTITQFWNRPN